MTQNCMNFSIICSKRKLISQGLQAEKGCILPIKRKKRGGADAYELSFRVYINRSDPKNGCVYIKYQSPNYVNVKFNNHEYSEIEYYWFVINSHWKSAAVRNYPKPEYIRIGDWL